MRALASWSQGPTPVLVAGGDFDFASGAPARNLARFSAGAWAGFGAGADGVVHALLGQPALPAGLALYAAGAFTVIDGRPSARFARTSLPGGGGS